MLYLNNLITYNIYNFASLIQRITKIEVIKKKIEIKKKFFANTICSMDLVIELSLK